MEAVTVAEAVEISILMGDQAGMQYQYWLATTFATIVASFAAGDRLDRSVKIGMAILYVFASILFCLIYITVISNYGQYIQYIEQNGIAASSPFGWTIAVFRFLVWLTGTAITVWFIFHKNSERKDA